MKKVFAATILSTVVLSSGCASIVSNSTYPVAINSNPEGADFVITNSKGVDVHSGHTPETVDLKSSQGYFSSAAYVIKFKKTGYSDKTLSLQGSIDGWYWANILFGGIIGMVIVDPATGAMWKLPEAQSASLAPTSIAANGGQLGKP